MKYSFMLHYDNPMYEIKMLHAKIDCVCVCVSVSAVVSAQVLTPSCIHLLCL